MENLAADETEESLPVRQEYEVQVMQSMYLDSFVDLREKDVWKISRPPEVKLTLNPLETSSGEKQINAKVDLYIKCNSLYPEAVPELNLQNAKGLSRQQESDLKFELEELATRLSQKKEEMMLELAQHVETYLSNHNHPRFGSFYEERQSNIKQKEEIKAKEEQKLKELQQLKEEQQRKAIDEEIKRKHEASREEAKCRRERLKQTQSGIVVPSEGINIPTAKRQHGLLSSPKTRQRSLSLEAVSASPPDFAKQRSGSVRRRRSTYRSEEEQPESPSSLRLGLNSLEFQNKVVCHIQRGKCLGRSPRGRTTYLGMDTNSGEPIIVTEWILKWAHIQQQPNSSVSEVQKHIENYIKQVSSIQTELNSLLKFRHSNLLHYLGMRFSEENDHVVIHVLQEYAAGSSLCHYLSQSLSMDVDLLRHYAKEILQAIAFLHRKSVAHKDLRDTSIFVDNFGTVRVGDYTIDKRLCDLHLGLNREPINHAQIYPPSLGRGARIKDINRLAVILVSFLNGKLVKDSVPDIPSSCPADLTDFLQKCLVMKDQDSADKLLEHSFLKYPLMRSPSPRKPLKGLEQHKQDVMEEPDPDLRNHLFPFVDGPSRLAKEFEILRYIGKGGFGDVLKVRNRLDRGIYAIKRILLNQKNKQLHLKLTREVTHLSRLNHENIVRYYYSWIEKCTTENEPNVDSSDFSERSITSQIKKAGESNNVSDTAVDDSRPAQAKADESVDLAVSEKGGTEEISSEYDDDDEQDMFGACYSLQSSVSDGGVVFEADSPPTDKIEQNKEETENSTEEKQSNACYFMFIQMEFCEKSTLRNAIDKGLHSDQTRVWRLFREIIEGLTHIHQQMMIHRDLKPANIFLDCNDHVKIGDFGLATTNIIGKFTHWHTENEISGALDSKSLGDKDSQSTCKSDTLDDHSQTRGIGTALYVAPEIAVGRRKTSPVYDQKVDLYSLGIIFFEMCYPALATQMERVTVLTHLRLPSINLPADFSEESMQDQVHIVQWLLNHDPMKRPTSEELLQSEYLPPPQMEEAELQEMIDHTINNPQSKAYKHMISSLFKQEVSPTEDHTYDMYMNNFNKKVLLTQKYVKETITKVLQKHGAIYVFTPLLVPRTELDEQSEVRVDAIDHAGGVISLPYGLRVPFARFVVKNNILSMTRYYISRVYKEKKVFGCHPKEYLECAFDIITPISNSLITDAEVLTVVWEIIMEFSALQMRSYVFHLNHTSILKAILIHCGIPAEKHSEICRILADTKLENLSKFHVQAELVNLDLSEQAVDTLCVFMETHVTIKKLPETLKPIILKKGMAAELAKQGLAELETILNNAEVLGLKAQVQVSPGIVHSIHHFSGIFFTVSCELKKKRKKSCVDVLAVGGRYDKLINSMRLPSSAKDTQFGIGASISLDKIAAALLDDKEFNPPPAFDILVCSVGHQQVLKDTYNIAKDLWASGIKAYMHFDEMKTFPDIADKAKEIGVTLILYNKESDVGTGCYRVRSLERDRSVNRKLKLSELSEYILKVLSTKNELQESVQQGLARTESSKSVSNTDSSSSPSLNITFVTLEKTPSHVKRRFEGQILSHASQALQLICSKYCVEVLAVDLSASVLKAIASDIELDGTEESFNESVLTITNKHHRYKKYLPAIFDSIRELKFQKQCPVIMLFGLSDNSFKVLL